MGDGGNENWEHLWTQIKTYGSWWSRIELHAYYHDINIYCIKYSIFNLLYNIMDIYIYNLLWMRIEWLVMLTPDFSSPLGCWPLERYHLSSKLSLFGGNHPNWGYFMLFIYIIIHIYVWNLGLTFFCLPICIIVIINYQLFFFSLFELYLVRGFPS